MYTVFPVEGWYDASSYMWYTLIFTILISTLQLESVCDTSYIAHVPVVLYCMYVISFTAHSPQVYVFLSSSTLYGSVHFFIFFFSSAPIY